MFTEKNTNMILAVFLVVTLAQTVFLVKATLAVSEANLGAGQSPSAVSFTDDGAAPTMVGGC